MNWFFWIFSEVNLKAKSLEKNNYPRYNDSLKRSKIKQQFLLIFTQMLHDNSNTFNTYIRIMSPTVLRYRDKTKRKFKFVLKCRLDNWIF